MALLAFNGRIPLWCVAAVSRYSKTPRASDAGKAEHVCSSRIGDPLEDFQSDHQSCQGSWVLATTGVTMPTFGPDASEEMR